MEKSTGALRLASELYLRNSKFTKWLWTDV